MKINDGQIITLDDKKDYIVLKQVVYNNTNYIYLITTSKPVEVMFVRQDADELNLVVDDNELKEVINLLNSNNLSE